MGKHQEIAAIVLAIVAFVLIVLYGFLTNILRESSKPDAPFSFHKLQLWLWTLVIAPAFAINWGYVAPAPPFTHSPNINDTGLILLGISAGAAVVSTMVAGALKYQKQKLESAKQVDFKLKEDQTSSCFWTDIIMDASGQVSVGRLQNLIFTIIYIGVYITMFIKADAKYPDFDNTAYLLMGISTSGYLIAKAQRN